MTYEPHELEVIAAATTAQNESYAMCRSERLWSHMNKIDQEAMCEIIRLALIVAHEVRADIDASLAGDQRRGPTPIEAEVNEQTR